MLYSSESNLRLDPVLAVCCDILAAFACFCETALLVTTPRFLERLTTRRSTCLRACCFGVSSGPGCLYRHWLRSPLLRDKLIQYVLWGLG